MKTIKNVLCVLLFSLGINATAQQTPAPKQSETILILGATAHIGNGTVIPKSAIGFAQGKLTFVGIAGAINTSDFSRVIDASGTHIYPGFILANSSLGLVEIDAVRASDDQGEIGDIIPHVRSLIAYNAESKIVESVRPNGVLTAQVTPRSGSISGSSSVMQLDAWNWEDAVLKADEGIHMNWPEHTIKVGRKPDKKLVLGVEEAKNYEKQVSALQQFMEQATAYLKTVPSSRNLVFEAIKGLFDGSKKLYIHANGKREIIDAVHFSQKAGIQNIVLVNGNQAHKVVDMLAAYKIPVVINRSHRLPDSDDEDIQLPFKLAKLLTDKGILVCIGMEGHMERMNSRNLPFYAGTFAAHGLDREKAVQLITGNAAKILGVDDLIGTLEVGKDATLFLSKGDALDMRTNVITHAFIQGREISLETHQTGLWKRYMEKYSRE